MTFSRQCWLFVLASMVCVSLACYASESERGGLVGNGGDGVECPNQLRVLDVFEAEEQLRWDLKLGPLNLSVEEKLEILLQRVRKFDQEMAHAYRNLISEFMASAVFWNGSIGDIDDAGIALIPPECRIVQLAAQQESMFPGDLGFVVNKKLFDRLDNDNKASLIWHEVVYHEALKMGHVNSRKTRYFIAHLLADRLPSRAKYYELVAELDMPQSPYEYKNLKLRASSVDFYDNGALKSGLTIGFGSVNICDRVFVVHPDTVVRFYKSGAVERSSFCFQRYGEMDFESCPKMYGPEQERSVQLRDKEYLTLPFSPDSYVRFYEDGYPKEVFYSTSEDVSETLKFVGRFRFYRGMENYPIKFFPSGQIRSIRRASYGGWVLRLQGPQCRAFSEANSGGTSVVVVDSGAEIYYHENGRIKSTVTSSTYDHKCFDSSGNVVIVSAGSPVSFDEQGQLLRE